MAQAGRDGNFVPTLLGVSNVDGTTPIAIYADPTTHRLLTDTASGSGTVTSVSVVTANGFAGTVATATTTPAITLTTTVTGILSGNGTAISAASTTGSGAVVLTSAPSISGAAITTSTVNGVTLTTGGSASQFLNGTGAYSTPASSTPTVITVANEATDTSCFLGFFTAATGDLGPKTNANLAFNSNTGVLTLVAPILGTPTSVTLTNATGLPVGTGISGLGTNVATALAVNVGSAGAFVTFNGALGTPSSGTVTNLTGTASININGTVGANTPTTATFTTATINTAVSLADGATIKMIVPTVDGTASGPTTAAFVSGYTSSAIGDLVILDSSGKWQKCDANTASIYNGMLGIALAVAATDAALLVALPGSFVYATAFPTMTIGATMYMSETAGAITATAPVTVDSATRVVGYAVHADKIFFFPSGIDYTTHT